MSFQFEEKPESRSGSGGTNSTEIRRYFSYGSNDRAYIEAMTLAATPTVIVGYGGKVLYRQDPSFDLNDLHCEIEVPYGPQQKATGSYTISFDTTGGTQLMKASYEVVGKWDATGDQVATKDDEGGAIGYDKTTNEIAGTDVIIPALKLNVAFRHPAATISESRIRTLARNSGKVNSSNFLGFDAGEVLFAGATGSQSESEAEVNYAFMCSENVNGLEIGGITINKDGWDFADVRFAEDTEAGKPVKPPKEIYVHRVYRRTNLAAVLGFGG
jgi:hypothetical protein